jgi:hypothetical protein
MAEKIQKVKPAHRTLSKDEAGLLLAISALIFGGWIRIFTGLSIDFPINDGGLFYKMVQVIQANGYSLPDYFSYNGLRIPFAYPPLAFFLAAILNSLLQIPLIDIFRLLPAVVLVFTIPAFYELAKTVMEDKLQAGIATIIFSLTPRSVTWFIMGGGITRSMGLLFLILAVRSIYLALTMPNKKYILQAIIFCGLVLLTHPEAAAHTAGIGILLWVMRGRNRRGTISTFLIGGGTVIISVIWWLPLLIRFGLEPILSAGQTGLNSVISFFYPFVPFNEEPYITFIMVMAFLGIAVEIVSKKYLLPALFFLPFLVELRSAANVAILPMAMLAASALFKLITPGIAAINTSNSSMDHGVFKRRVVGGTVLFLLLYALAMMFTHVTTLSNQRVSRSNLTAFNWVRNNTPAESRFLVITGTFDLFRDWTQEWFPVLTERISLTTIQGREWLNESNFEALIEDFQYIQSCANSEALMLCIRDGTRRANINYDFIYIAKVTANIPLKYEPKAAGLVADLKRSKDFMLVYESSDVAIFELISPPD